MQTFFQHIPYLEKFNAEKKTELVPVAKIFIAPLAVYSKKNKEYRGIKKMDLL